MGNLKTIIPLVVGVMMLGAAVGGAALSLLSPSRSAKRSKAVVQLRESKKAEKEAEPELSAAEREALEKANVKRILLEQIDQTPDTITDEWIAELCTYVTNEAQLKAFVDAAIERGAKFDFGYTAEFKEKSPRKIMSEDPRTYITLALDLIYKPGITEKYLNSTARGLLDMALYREHKRAQEEVEESGGEAGMRDEIVSAWFKETLRLYKTLRKVAAEAGKDVGAYRKELIEMLEATVVDRHYMIQNRTAEARKRFSETTSSAKAITLRIGSWNKTLNAYLLELGELYVEAAWEETTYKGRQRHYADLGFVALAMVHQRTKGPEALLVLREANRIQRYNMWKMGQAHWSKANRAAAAGKHELAEEQYLQAKRRYLQALVRIEESKKRRIFTEFRILQKEINNWRMGMTGAVDSAQTPTVVTPEESKSI